MDTFLSENSRVILKQRYQSPSDKTPDDVFRRVASHIAQAELQYNADKHEVEFWQNTFFEAMRKLLFLPNSPCLRNAGVYEGSLSACYVIPIDDMMQAPTTSSTHTGITDAGTAAIMVQKFGGGTGFSGGRIRPRGDAIQSTHKAACGPVSVLKWLNACSELVTQAAFRAGANMFILPVHHPDILEFIDCKTADPEALSRFNISVAIDDDFMLAYREHANYFLINPRTGERTGEKLDAREVIGKIARAAWTTGDPGIFNVDLANLNNPDKHKTFIEATNPCSEQTLPPWGSCTLGSIDISKFVVNGLFDVPAFRDMVKLGVRFLDDVVTINTHPLPQIQEQATNDRRIGLDIMGWHDFLILSGVAYGSGQGIAMAHNVGAIFQKAADECSEELAKERGAYPWFEGSARQRNGGSPIRNATRTNMAPTGTRSIIANCSSGIEPRFGLANWRKYFDPEKEIFVQFPAPEVGKAFETIAIDNDFMSDRLVAALANGQNFGDAYHQIIGEGPPTAILEVLATAQEISPEWHIKMQAAWQSHVDNAISKTINLPNKAQVEDVETALVLALESGCVSTTVYRDGSRDNQILTNGKKPAATSFSANGSRREKLPITRESLTHKMQIADWEGYLTMGKYPDGRLGEIFVACQEGSTMGGLLDAWATTVSISLQTGVPLADLTRKMRNTRFEPHGLTPNTDIRTATSIIDYIGHFLEQTFLNGDMTAPAHSGAVCPTCGGQMIIQMGCHVCEACGYEKCG